MSRGPDVRTARRLNHAELVYAPGERDLTYRLFDALGCRVVDPQRESPPPGLGPAGSAYLIVFLDPASDDLIDNVLYASEVPPAQWAFERRLRERLESDAELAAAQRAMHEAFAELPQALTHIGLAFPAVEALESACARLEADAQLERRTRRSPIYRPGGPGSVDDRVVQAFVHTDVCSSGLLATGQQLELQVRLDR